MAMAYKPSLMGPRAYFTPRRRAMKVAGHFWKSARPTSRNTAALHGNLVPSPRVGNEWGRGRGGKGHYTDHGLFLSHSGATASAQGRQALPPLSVSPSSALHGERVCNGKDVSMLAAAKIWYRAIRPFSLSAAVVPVIVGSALATQYGVFDWFLFLLVLLGSLLVQCGTNLTDEYADHRPGRETTHKVQAPYKVIALGLLTPVAVRRGAMTCFGLAALIGVYLVARTSWPLALICLASVGVAYGYSAGPLPLGHLGLGEPLVFVFMGPVMVLGSF